MTLGKLDRNVIPWTRHVKDFFVGRPRLDFLRFMRLLVESYLWSRTSCSYHQVARNRHRATTPFEKRTKKSSMICRRVTSHHSLERSSSCYGNLLQEFSWLHP
jgi:hypothetical protein